MTAPERAVIAEVRAWLVSKMAVPCTACAYCGPCPSGVNIVDTFGMWNEAAMFGTVDEIRGQYRSGLQARGNCAKACVECGQCSPKCPQGIDIPARLKEADAYLGIAGAF